ncbi:unnamed protein product [[Candida] boidinii]|uniref:Unnamed protein product n=1 Tax=Candida boidinii TaxID=5477 RepID=A0ACB5TTN3_CANBO|nr:unnamed protein product [[Candida] boidinii]
MSDRQDQFKSGVSNTQLDIINEEHPQLIIENDNNDDDDLTSINSSSRLNQNVSHINNRNNSNSVLSDLNSSLSSLNSGGLNDESTNINHLTSNYNSNTLQINNTTTTTTTNPNSYTNHRRNISDSSFASSFLQSNSGTVIGSPALNSNSISNFNQDLSIGMSPDDSNLSIGFNNISEKTVSPLGQNSIYELVYSSDKNRKTSTGLLTAQSGNAVISLRGPTTRDIPPIQLSKIMKVKSSQFKPYLTSINDEFKKFQLNNNLTASTLEAFMNELSEEERKTKQIKQNHLKNSENISQETLDDDDDDVVVDDNDNDQNIFDDVGGEYDKNSLDTIPQIYFEKDFRLDDPHVL